jgi:hypothetical protein
MDSTVTLYKNVDRLEKLVLAQIQNSDAIFNRMVRTASYLLMQPSLMSINAQPAGRYKETTS